MNWYTKDRETVLLELNTSKEGLDEQQVRERIEKYGLNELAERGLRSPLAVLAGQFTEIMVIVLLIAAVISFFTGHPQDAIIILIIVVLNAILGFTQEYRAEKAMAALKKLSVPNVKVRSEGQIKQVDANRLVHGDIVLIEIYDIKISMHFRVHK